MKLYYGGAEAVKWKEVLAANNVPSVSMSYLGLMNRQEKDILSYPGEVFLDSGAYTYNKDNSRYDFSDAYETAAKYMDFIKLHIDDVTLVSEFDAKQLEEDTIQKLRTDFYDNLPADKFMPIWHPEYGRDELERLCSSYKIVGVCQADIHGDTTHVPIFNSYIQHYGTRLHGVGITSKKLLEAVGWDSVSSTSWISPTMYGDSVTGDTLIWYRDSSGVGLDRIEALYQRGETFEVRTVNKYGAELWSKATAYRHEFSEDKKIYEITTLGHNRLKVTSDHSLFRWKNNLEEHVRTEELKVGDRILYGRPALSSKNQETIFLNVPYRNTELLRIGIELDKEFCEFLGLFWADGHHDSSGLAVSAGNDPECFDLLCSIAKRFGVSAELRKNGVDVRISSKILSEIVKVLGFSKFRSHEKVIPRFVFTLGKEQVAAYLRGYFSGDGCGHDYFVNVSSTSLPMLCQVRYLLECFDILPTIGSGQLARNRKVQSKHASYPLLISDGISVKIFLDQIGFLQPRKTSAVTPKEVTGNNGRRYQPQYALSRYERVTGIEEVPHEKFVYDLNVPDTQRFWANGIIAHNTFVWTGRELKRYPKAYKERARRSHRVLFEDNGFDSRKIEADDPAEILNLSLWSWQKYIESISVVTSKKENRIDRSEDMTHPAVDNLPTGNGTEVVPQRKVIALPIMQTVFKETQNDDNNEDEEKTQIPHLIIRSESMRVCDTCFLKDKCPGFQPASTCLYNIPIEVRTKDQLRSLHDALIEMQTHRVLFMKMAEDLGGGYADPNLSMEIDRLNRMIKTKTDGDRNTFSATLNISEAPSGPGFMEKVFGNKAIDKLRALESPVPADELIKETEIGTELGSEIFEAEVIDD